MAHSVRKGGGSLQGRGRAHLAWAWLGLALSSASCVPVGTTGAPRVELAASALSVPASIQPGAAPLPVAAVAPVVPQIFGGPIAAANAAIPIFGGPNPLAASYVFRGRTPLDQLRSLDCLAQAIYYEARSESEDGQRAVAQVVLNRVRHPAWPNSVCGVVYQGPMRPGGGCQFTFTCDGSLAYRPAGPGWARARALAAEALAGRVYAGVGLSTHYHTHQVLPSWAPRLLKTAVIGAHNFYRLPGGGGGPLAFAASYAGSEPMPRPAMRMMPRTAGPSLQLADVLPRQAFSAAELRAAVAIPSDIPQDPRWTASNLPASTVREEYRESGQWRPDAPAAVTGR